jgi:hypothetical protein
MIWRPFAKRWEQLQIKYRRFFMFRFVVFILVIVAGSMNMAYSFEHVLLNDQRVEAIAKRIESKQEPTYAAFKALQKSIQPHIDRQSHAPEHWYVPGYYRDAEGHASAKQGLADDANRAYELALLYRLTDDPTYAKTAIGLINGWATTVKTLSQKDDSTLSFSYHFPPMIFAADLLKNCPLWPKPEQGRFARFVREKALPQHTMDRQNNWGNWGLVLVLSAATYVDDQDLFNQGVQRWKEFIERQIAEDGHLPHEVNRNQGRSGIWYSNFSLQPQTIAAEIARTNGVYLYDYKASNGRSLRQAFEKLAPWTHHPETFPYWKGKASELTGVDYVSYYEILNQIWPNTDATDLLRTLRPMTARHGLPVLTLTHAGLFTLSND